MKILGAAAMAALFVSSSAFAQTSGEARLYSGGNFSGPSVPISGPAQRMSPIAVKSVEIPAGSSWDLCTGNTFTGCKTFTASDPAMVMTVRSVRPVAPPIPASAAAAVAAQGAEGSGASLRGLASEFFVIPDEAGARIEVPAAGDLSRVAIGFCRSKGWRTSAHGREQSVGGRNLLADVLCVNDDR